MKKQKKTNSKKGKTKKQEDCEHENIKKAVFFGRGVIFQCLDCGKQKFAG